MAVVSRENEFKENESKPELGAVATFRLLLAFGMAGAGQLE
jgi:hypothetical protein